MSQTLLWLWDDIRTWIKSQKIFILPDLATEIPSDKEYWEWRKSFIETYFQNKNMC
jgi:hypothetical protein